MTMQHSTFADGPARFGAWHTRANHHARPRPTRARVAAGAAALSLVLLASWPGGAMTVRAASRAGVSQGTAAAQQPLLPGPVPAGLATDAVLVQPTAPPPPFTPAITARLTAALSRLRAADHLPGIQAVVRYPDGAAWKGHAGFADLADHQVMGTLTLLDAGSITKTFVAALAIQLAGQGVFGLDDPVERWLPDLPYVSGVTIRELLDHTSGIEDPFNNKPFLAALGDHPSRAWTAAQVLAQVGKPYFAPGQGWAYSNANYILLGQVIERATGQPLATLLRQRLFGPLRLTHTYLQGEEPVSGPVAHGYEYTSYRTWKVKDLSDGSPYLPFTSLATSLGAAGALVTTADDLARWALYLYRGRVLPPAELSQMLDFGLTSAFHPTLPYGLGVQRRSLDGLGSWGHAGSLSGFRAAMRYFPSAGVSITVMANGEDIDPDAAVASLLAALYPPAGT